MPTTLNDLAQQCLILAADWLQKVEVLDKLNYASDEYGNIEYPYSGKLVSCSTRAIIELSALELAHPQPFLVHEEAIAALVRFLRLDVAGEYPQDFGEALDRWNDRPKTRKSDVVGALRLAADSLAL